MTRVDDYGLRRYIGGSSGLSSGECFERFELTQKALSDWRGETGVAGGSLGDFYDWLMEGERLVDSCRRDVPAYE